MHTVQVIASSLVIKKSNQKIICLRYVDSPPKNSTTEVLLTYLFDAEINCLRKLLSFCYILYYTPRLHENGLFQILKREKALDRKQGIDCNKSDCPPSETPICQRTQNKIPYRITSSEAKRRITQGFKSIHLKFFRF